MGKGTNRTWKLQISLVGKKKTFRQFGGWEERDVMGRNGATKLKETGWGEGGRCGPRLLFFVTVRGTG